MWRNRRSFRRLKSTLCCSQWHISEHEYLSCCGALLRRGEQGRDGSRRSIEAIVDHLHDDAIGGNPVSFKSACGRRCRCQHRQQRIDIEPEDACNADRKHRAVDEVAAGKGEPEFKCGLPKTDITPSLATPLKVHSMR